MHPLGRPGASTRAAPLSCVDRQEMQQRRSLRGKCPVLRSDTMDQAVEKVGAVPLRAEDHLRDAIVTGRLQPNERLVESDLARSLGVSRTLVRTALARLEQEGLVEHERHRGARVRLVEQREAVEILEARSVLEGLAARFAAQRATAEDIDELRDILDEMHRLREADDLVGVSEENARLHRRLMEIGGHATASRLISTLNTQLVRFQYRTILLPGRGERSLREHVAIIDAIAAGDPEAAEAAMRTHLSQVADALRRSQRA
jgi:DNA-binding GntR family transcriptional regulator